MKKIKIIFPINSKEFMNKNKVFRSEAKNSKIEIDFTTIPNGPNAIETMQDVELATKPLIEAAKQAENDGFDGVIIDCAADPAISHVRKSISIPVVGAGESSYKQALNLLNKNEKFSIIVPLKSSKVIIENNIHKNTGVINHIASLRVVDIPVQDLSNNNDKVFDAIFNECNLAIKNDNAKLIVLGCTGMAVQAKNLRKKLSIDVIDPGISAIEQLQSMIL